MSQPKESLALFNPGGGTDQGKRGGTKRGRNFVHQGLLATGIIAKVKTPRERVKGGEGWSRLRKGGSVASREESTRLDLYPHTVNAGPASLGGKSVEKCGGEIVRGKTAPLKVVHGR